MMYLRSIPEYETVDDDSPGDSNSDDNIREMNLMDFINNG